MEMTDEQVCETVEKYGANQEECARLNASLSCLRSVHMAGEQVPGMSIRRGSSGSLCPRLQVRTRQHRLGGRCQAGEERGLGRGGQKGSGQLLETPPHGRPSEVVGHLVLDN